MLPRPQAVAGKRPPPQSLLLSPRGGGPAGRRPSKHLRPVYPELRDNASGEPTLHFEPRPLPPRINTPSEAPLTTAPTTPAATALADGFYDPEYPFLSGVGAKAFVLALRAGAASPRPGAQRFAYFREEGLAEQPIREGSALPNPFHLILIQGTPGAPTAARYLTVSPNGGVTLWVDGAAREVYPLDEWRIAHASFARVARAPILRRARQRHTFRQWLACVQRARGARRLAALLRERREAQDELEAMDAPAVTAGALAPAIEVVRRVAGWIRGQRLEAQQTGHAAAGGDGDGAPMTFTVELGAANGDALVSMLRGEIRRATGTLASALAQLREELADPETQPLALANPEGCKYLLEKYSRRIYPTIASAHFNNPIASGLIERGGVAVGVLMPPPAKSLRGASIEKLEQWIGQASPRTLHHTAEHVTRVHMGHAARMVRQADMLVAGAVLQLPLDAVRAFLSKFKGSGWRRLASPDAPPVLTLRIVRADGGGGSPLKLAVPSPAALCQQLLRRCVGCLRELQLPSERGDFDTILTQHLITQCGTQKVTAAKGVEGDGARRRPRGVDSGGTDDDDDEGGGGEKEANEVGGGDADGPHDAATSELDAQAESAWVAHVAAVQAQLPGFAAPPPPTPPPEPPALPPRPRAGRALSRADAGADTTRVMDRPVTLRSFLELHYFTAPMPQVVEVLRDLEKSLTAAIRRAEATAVAHKPFLDALTEEGQAQVAQTPALRTLDVGCIRVDAVELWPDEARELNLEPFFAPMSLTEQLTGYGKETPPAVSTKRTQDRKLPPGVATITAMLAFLQKERSTR
jgi:hypothetical protein